MAARGETRDKTLAQKNECTVGKACCGRAGRWGNPWNSGLSGLGFDQGTAGLGGGRMEAAYLELQGLLQLVLVLLPRPFQAVQLLV